MDPAKAIATAARRRASLRAASEAAVQRWAWASGPRPTIEPFYFERHGFSPGKLIAKPRAAPPAGVHAYGYDAAGRVVLEREYTEWPGLTKDTYWVHHDDGIEQWHFDHEWEGVAPIIHVGWFALRRGRLASSSFAYRRGTAARTRYTWTAGRLSRARGAADERFEYDADGQLLKVICDGDVRYARAVRGRLLEDVAPALRAELERAIRRQLARLRAAEPVRALALVLDEECFDHLLPPMLGAPTTSERAALPAEWALFAVPQLAYASAKLRRLCASANQDIWQHQRHRAARRLVKDVARALSERPPAGPGWQRARTFTVYVTDLETGRRK